jgi:hypothetical protein
MQNTFNTLTSIFQIMIPERATIPFRSFGIDSYTIENTMWKLHFSTKMTQEPNITQANCIYQIHSYIRENDWNVKYDSIIYSTYTIRIYIFQD